jgi:uncharacterized protein YggE
MSRRFWMLFTGAACLLLLVGALFFVAGGSFAGLAHAQASTPTASAGIRTVLTGTPPAGVTATVMATTGTATVMATTGTATVMATSMPLTGTATVTPAVRAPRVVTGTVPAGVVRSITVVGDGMVSVQPDTANTNLGYEVVTDTVKAGTAAVSRTMSSILDALHGLGIADKDIQTSNYNISMDNNPGSNPASGPTQHLQYRVNSTVSVTIHDLTKVGAVLDTAVNAGANSVYGVMFTIQNQNALDRRAYSLAMDDADARAAYLAGLAGVTLGPVISVSAVIGQGPGPLYSKAAMGGGGGSAIQPGELQVDRQLEVVYSIIK